MFRVKVGAAVINQLPLDWRGNQERVVAVLREARSRGVSLLCLPEMCLPGYGCEDAFHSASVIQRSWAMLHALLPETRGLVTCLGLPVLFHNAVFNAVALVADGRLLGVVAKQHLAGDGIHYEPRWFKAWPREVTSRLEPDDLAPEGVPLGDLIFDVGGVRIAFEICEDAWVASRPGAEAARLGADIILNPSASHFAFGKLEVRHRFVSEGSRAFGVSYVYANLLGLESGRAIYDGGALIASGGRVIAQGSRFSFKDSHLTTAVVDVEATRMAQARTASFRPAFRESEGLIRAPHTWIETPADPLEALATWESSPRLKEEEFARAEALALFDYLRKSRSHGFVLSLSGGADSTAVACLVALMVRFAAQDLGLDGLKRRLAYIPGLANAADERAIVNRLLFTAYQGTANSGDTTRDAAARIADLVGAEHRELDIDALVGGYVGLVQGAVGRALDWDRDDLALQNIQARARGPGIWLIANLRNALLLATSNRSEAAVGYATMDGDTCGGLSPIAGIDKYFLRLWLSWLEREGPIGIGAWPALSCVNDQRSTPELRPGVAAQTSEGDLMPFDILDAVERAAIRDKRAPVEVWRLMCQRFAHVAPRDMAIWVEHFFTLWSRNQWKRERYAPSFHLDDENLDPKTWCRFPILSGGFAVELEELRLAAGL